MTKVHLNPDLFDEGFGRQAITVRAMQEWAGGILPPTQPDIAGFDVVQIEALLHALSAGALELCKSGETESLVNAALQLAADPKAHRNIAEGNREMALWLLSANPHLQWRNRIAGALADGSLQAIDAVTLLPVGPPVLVKPRTYVKRPQAHADAILKAIVECGMVAKSLPFHRNGARNSPKSKIKAKAGLSDTTFAKTWQMMLDDGEIKEAATLTLRQNR